MRSSNEHRLDRKEVLRKGYALRCNEIAPSFGVCDGCISRRRCQVGVRKIRKNTDRAPKRGRASFGTQVPSVDLNHLAASGGDFTRKALTSKGIRLAAYRLLRVVFMIAGDLAAYFIGLITEEAFGSQASLIVFLTLYFLFLWVAWVLAVWMTEPKHTASVSTESG
jgi:hypothetical protein